MTNEFQLVEKRELREEFIGRMEVLDKVGDLILLPSTEFATTEQVATYRDWETDRKSTRLNSSHSAKSRMPSSA